MPVVKRKERYDFHAINDALDIENTGPRFYEEEYEVEEGQGCSGERNGFYGKKHTEETKRIISEKSKLLPKYCRANYGEKNGMYGSARFGELNPMWGKKQKQSTKDKISAANKGKPHGNPGVPCPETTKAALAKKNSRKYVVVNPEGKRVEINNLAKFCRDNDLNEMCMRHMIAGRNKQHKGWTNVL